MAIDAATRRNLELTRNLVRRPRRHAVGHGGFHRHRGGGAGLVPAPGRAARPMCKTIAARHDAVELFPQGSELRRHLREALRQRPRSVARLGAAIGAARRAARSGQYPRCHQGGARLCATVFRHRAAGGELQAADAISPRPGGRFLSLADKLNLLLVDEPPYFTRDGGFVRFRRACAIGRSTCHCAINPAG